MLNYFFYLKVKNLIIKPFIILLLIIIINKGIFFNRYLKYIKYKVKSVCLCSPAKQENRYIEEFIKYYLNLGVDKIFIYDNNNIGGEKFEDVIFKYIKRGSVEIINIRGKEKAQFYMMNDCYKKNFDKFDWLFFFDVDEFLFLKNYKNVKAYLSNDYLDKCDKIHFNCIFHTDNNLLYYDKGSLFQRFFEREPKVRFNLSRKAGIKTIIRGHLKNIKRVECIHRISLKLPSCNPYGNITTLDGIETLEADYENYYINHFYCKSTEEFINKINKGCAVFGFDNNWKMARVKTYFGYNKITIQKINLIENNTNLNLTKFKIKIHNNNYTT